MNVSGRTRRSGFVAVAAAAAVAAPLVVLEGSRPSAADEPGSVAARSFAQPSLRPSAYPDDKTKVELVASQPSSAGNATADVGAGQPAKSGKHERATAPKPATPKVEPSWPKTIPEAKAEAEPAKPEAYSEAEIATAKAHCAAVLKGLDVVIVPEAPFKAGACGAPAPVQLVSIGKSPQVALSPPVTVTCDVVAAMHKWVTGDVQALAKKHLGAHVIGIDTMSSYSCRNAYGRKRTNLSEHGRANAIDIRSFHTSDAKETVVLNEWGPTVWEVRAAAKAAAEKAAAEKLAAEKAAAKAQQAAAAKPPASPAKPAEDGSTATTGGIDIVGKIPGIAPRLPGSDTSTGLGLVKPSHLGGPKTVAQPGGDSPTADAALHARRAQFLRAAHDAACKIFGTTLGPETNYAHKNHFHVDMAERARGNFCE